MGSRVNEINDKRLIWRCVCWKVSALKIDWVILVAAVLVSSCDETPSGKPEPVIPDPLEQVGKILGSDGVGPKNPPVPAVDGNGNPVIPTAEPVPNKPGFVISPYNGKWIDVTGLPVGEAVADPDFPVEEKKYFRVPKPLPVKGDPETAEELSPGETTSEEE